MKAPKRDRVDNFILVFAGAMLVASLYFIFDRQLFSRRSPQSVNQAPIAKVVSISNDVRARKEEEFAWIEAFKSDDLYENESVFTGKSSGTEIQLIEGSLLSVGEDSLITISGNSRSDTSVNIRKGVTSFKLSGNKKIKLKIAGKEHEISGSDSSLRVQRNEKGEADIAIVGGSVVIKQDGTEKILQKNDRVMLTKTGEVAEVKHYSIELLAPANDAQIYLSKGEGLDFSWTALDGVDEYRFEISNDPFFSNLIEKSTVRDTKLHLNRNLSGELFWRIRARDRKQQPKESLAFRLTSSTAAPPEPVSPDALSILKIREGEELPARFLFTDDTNSGTYEMQVSKKPDFTNLEKTARIEGTSASVGMKEPGEYFWRVRAVTGPAKNAGWSQVIRFSLGRVASIEEIKKEAVTPEPKSQPNEVAEKKKIQPPRLVHPAYREQIFVDSEKHVVDLKWVRQREIGKFEVQISDKENFEFSSTRNKYTDTNVFDAELSKPGVYYWRVRAIDGDEKSEYSEASRFETIISPKKDKLRAPKTKTKKVELEVGSLDGGIEQVSAVEKVKELHLEWNKVKDARKYVFQLSRTPLFTKTILDIEVNENEFSWEQPQAGRFFWRVCGVDEDGIRGEFSEPAEILISVKPPRFLHPDKWTLEKETDSLDEYEEKEVPLEVKWTESSFAKSYVVQLSEHAGFSSMTNVAASESKASIKIPKNKDLYLRVAAAGEKGEPIGHFSNPILVRYNYRLIIEPPKIETAKYMPVFEADKNVAATISMDWKKSKYTEASIVEISADSDFRKIIYGAESSDHAVRTDVPVDKKNPNFKVYGRVRTRFRKNLSAWSEPVELKLNDEQRVQILDAKRRKGFVLIGGMILQDYTESLPSGKSIQIQSVALAGRLEILKPLPKPNFDYWGSFGIEGIAIQKDIVLTTVTLASGLAYKIQPLKKDWYWSLHFGPYYRKTILSTDNLGYKNLFGPQFTLKYKKDLTTTQKGIAYVRYAYPYSGGFSPTITNRELALGALWIYGIQNLIPISVGAEYGRVDVSTANLNLIQSNSAFLTLGTYW